MTQPTFAQLKALASAVPPVPAETVMERVVTLLAMIASGINPDGTGGGIAIAPPNIGGLTQRIPTGSGEAGQSLAAGSSAVGPGSTVFALQQVAGPGISGPSAPNSNASMVVVASAGTTAGVVALQVTLDGSNWATPTGATITLTAPGTFGVAVLFPAIGVRANITTAITGGTIQANVAQSG